MAELIFSDEAMPDTDLFPGQPEGLNVSHALWETAWLRVEQYTAHRWIPRAVTWITEGPGLWRPPLTPFAASATEVWAGSEWLPITLDTGPGPFLTLPTLGAYRFTGTAGADAGEIPPCFMVAAERLARYMADPGKPGVTSERVQAGSVVIAKSRAEDYLARSLQSSGAADLLRYYRRA